MNHKTEECVMCGFCCETSPCPWGVWDAKNKRCAFLITDNECGKYDSIMEDQKDDEFKMFGSGCSSTLFNLQRDAKLGQIDES